MKRVVILAVSHVIVGVAGFIAGIYLLPILTAPAAPTSEATAAATEAAIFSGHFRRDLEGSDFLHWGEGEVSISPGNVSLKGKIAPGPDYKLYLSPKFVETEEAFNALKSEMVRIGDVKTFDNFIVPVQQEVDVRQYNTVVVWCESFGEFITAAKYQ